MVKISWTDCERNELLQRVEEERNILHPIKKKATLTGHILRRKYLLERNTEG